VSTESAQAKASGEEQQFQAQLSKNLSALTTPQLRQMIGPGGIITNALGSTANGTLRSSMDQKVYDESKASLDSAYGQAAFGNRESTNYAALRGGEGRLSSAVPGAAIGQAATALERDRQSALANLKFSSAASSMTNYNQLLGLFGQGVNQSLNLAQGFSGAAHAAIGGLSNQSQFGNTLGGASAGAGLGATIGSVIPGVGTVVGGAVGGLAGGILGYGT
jgi:hypothetical protein